VRVVEFLKTRTEVNPNTIGALAIRNMGIPLLHAAAFNTSIQHVVLVNPLISFRSVAMTRLHKLGLISRPDGNYWHPFDIDFSWGVAGVLSAYDLPDLIGSVAPRKIILAGLKDATLETASDVLIKEELRFSRAAYEYKQAVNNIEIISAYEDLKDLVDRCFKLP